MTRVRMPPDPKTGCITTIVDSQQGDVALERLAATAAAAVAAKGDHSQQSQLQQQQQLLLDRSALSGVSNTSTNTAATASSAPSVAATSSQIPAASLSQQNVDSIVLVYDLDRPETFFRLENHWLPLIERTYQATVPVIVAENKVDLYRPTSSTSAAAISDEQALARKRQQIVSLMQRYPFVRQCIKVSAKNLLRIDDVFLKAQQAVLYPFTPPLYDLSTGQLSPACRRALARIFRIYDQDHDNLLSDAELDRFQRDTYHVGVFARDYAAWKKVVARADPTVECVVNNSFTVAGFGTIFDVFITQNRLDVVWEALRKFGYDDDLNLHVPESVTWGGGTDEMGASSPSVAGGMGGKSSSSSAERLGLSYWKLSSSAKHFLAAVFQQFDSDKDGVLSPEDLIKIFAILPQPALPPWHPTRAKDLFRGCFSIPKYLAVAAAGSAPVEDMSPSLIVPGVMSTTVLPSQSGMSLLSSGDSFPSTGGVDVYDSMLSEADPQSGTGDSSRSSLLKPLDFLEWMGYWHVLSAISPTVTREELFRLGHIEDMSSSHRKKATSNESRRRWKSKHRSQQQLSVIAGLPDAALKSREIRILVLGSRGAGKTALLNYLRNDTTNNTRTRATVKPETSTAHLKLTKRNKQGDNEEFVVHLVFTDVPETAAATQETYYRQLTELFGSVTSPKDRVCDLAMLVFDSTVASSLTYAKELESTLLTRETPRVFVGTKKDRMTTEQVFEAAKAHCQDEDLEGQPLLTSAEDRSDKDREAALEHLARCALNEPGVDRFKSRPYEEQERREAEKRRRMLWIGGIVGVVLVVGVGWLWGSSSPKKETSNSGGGSFAWLRHIFGRPCGEDAMNVSDLQGTKSPDSFA